MSTFQALWRRLFHRHKWRDTKINRYCIAIEQECACGAFRHQMLGDFDWGACVVRWRDGPFPESTTP